jgi:hypothetical protein|tara:strand:+ start:461 stop:1072 length:612 start_codon:yes stop_codon:yes gene_type:complete
MSNVTEIELDIDYDKLRKEFEELNIEKFLVENKGQMMIQTMSGTPEEQQALLGTLSLYVDWDNHNPNDPNSQPEVRDVILDEKDFTETCDFIKGTYTEEVINIFKEKYGVVRGRYMMMNWKSCLTYHNDETPRIHLPLITNDGCFMIIDDKTEKLHESTTYLVDTTKRHTALNAGEHLRFHMVFCLPPVKDGRTKNQLEFDLE